MGDGSEEILVVISDFFVSAQLKLDIGLKVVEIAGALNVSFPHVVIEKPTKIWSR